MHSLRLGTPSCGSLLLLIERFQSDHRWVDGGEAATHAAPELLREMPKDQLGCAGAFTS